MPLLRHIQHGRTGRKPNYFGNIPAFIEVAMNCSISATPPPGAAPHLSSAPSPLSNLSPGRAEVWTMQTGSKH